MLYKKKYLKNQKSTIHYLLSCADTRLLWGLNLPGSPYILHTNFSLHGSSRTANSWNISSNFCTTGVYTGSCVATCCSAFGGLPWPWNYLRQIRQTIILCKCISQVIMLIAALCVENKKKQSPLCQASHERDVIIYNSIVCRYWTPRSSISK